jgi:septal ring factor EnvC (AmiA/AmiB activator)
MGDAQGPEKVNNTCVKTVHVGTMGRGFTVIVICRLKAEEERNQLEGKLEEVHKERDVVQQECEELKVQLHLAEDRFDANQNHLQETTRKLKEGL